MMQLLRHLRVRRLSVVGTLLVLVLLLHFNIQETYELPSPVVADHIANPKLADIISSDMVVSQIAIRTCPKFLSCNPYKKDPSWLRYLTPLNLHASPFSWRAHLYNYHLFIQYAELKEVNQLITDIKISRSSSAPTSQGTWHQVPLSSSINIWHQYTHRDGMGEDDFAKVLAVRDIDILYGVSDLVDLRPFWDYQPQPIHYPFTSVVPGHLSLLKFSSEDLATIKDETLRFEKLKRNNMVLTSTDTFKVLQLSDLHFGQDLGKCFDHQNCKLDFKTIRFIEEALHAENPNLIVITGDLLDFPRLKNFKPVILKGLAPILRLGTPFVFTFGESDYDPSNYETKQSILQFISSLPNCYNVYPSDDTLHGLTNYNLKMYHVRNDLPIDLAKLGENKPNAIITVLDSENREIDLSQVSYIYRINQMEAPTTEKKSENTNTFKLMFFHYPLPNFRPVGTFQLVGSYNQKHKLNSRTNPKVRDDLLNCGYHVVGVGHEHENDACLLSVGENDKLIWLCYNSITGDSGETALDVNYKRKMRVFEINVPKAELLTWKVQEPDANSFDPQRIYQFK